MGGRERSPSHYSSFENMFVEYRKLSDNKQNLSMQFSITLVFMRAGQWL
jgi:hypothetical protein